MTALERVTALWSAILDASALAAAALTAGLLTRRRLTVVEGDERELLLSSSESGTGSSTEIVLTETDPSPQAARVLRRSHVTIELNAKRFVFHTIELPGRAAEYVEAIVRHQIDRLTPWSPERVIFGWSRAAAAGQDGTISVSIAATNKDLVMPLLRRVQDLGATDVEARVSLPPDVIATGAEPSVVLARNAAPSVGLPFWRRCLGIATLIVVALVVGASLYAQVATFRLASAAADLSRENAAKRAAIMRSNNADPSDAARRYVAQRKIEAPVLTIVLEALSRTLPDASYVTTIEITGSRIRLVGFTNDAPALISLIGTSDVFTDASFFAPTTRLPEDAADRFSIEASIRPGAKLQ